MSSIFALPSLSFQFGLLVLIFEFFHQKSILMLKAMAFYGRIA